MVSERTLLVLPLHLRGFAIFRWLSVVRYVSAGLQRLPLLLAQVVPVLVHYLRALDHFDHAIVRLCDFCRPEITLDFIVEGVVLKTMLPLKLHGSCCGGWAPRCTGVCTVPIIPMGVQ